MTVVAVGSMTMGTVTVMALGSAALAARPMMGAGGGRSGFPQSAGLMGRHYRFHRGLLREIDPDIGLLEPA